MKGSGLGLSTLTTNLVPYYMLHFTTLSCVPMQSSVSEMTEMAFESRHNSLDCDPFKSKFVSCALIYRSCPLLQIEEAIAKLRTKGLQFSVSERYKYGNINKEPFVFKEESFTSNCTLINNNCSVINTFKKMQRNFNLLWNKRSHMWWYLSAAGSDGKALSCDS